MEAQSTQWWADKVTEQFLKREFTNRHATATDLKVEIVEYARATWTREFSLSFHKSTVDNVADKSSEAEMDTNLLVNSDGLIITKETLSDGIDNQGHDFTHYRFEFKAHNLDKMDKFGLSDPYMVLSRPGANRNTLQIHKTEIIKLNLNPTWAPFVIPVADFCAGDLDAPITATVYDWDRLSQDDLIGSCQFTLRQLLKEEEGKANFDLVNPTKVRRQLRFPHQHKQLVSHPISSHLLYSRP